MALDKRIIDYFKSHLDPNGYFDEDINEEELEKFFDSIGYKDLYFSGFYDCGIEKVPVGTKFFIDEYDGAESIVTYEAHNAKNWVTVPEKQ